MHPYQEQYIENCRAIRALTAADLSDEPDFDRYFSRVIENRRKARELACRNTQLLEDELLPLLDDLYLQDRETLAGLEKFADALMKGPRALDVPLAGQLHEALLSCARRSGDRPFVIRELYKLGMARYSLWNMLTGLDEVPELHTFTSRMRYCFVEASSYLKFFEELEDEDTKSYVLRSTANIYMGAFSDWRQKLECVRNTMRVFCDERYRKSAPGLPWERYLQSVHRQMSGVLPYNLECGSLSPSEVADVMYSTQLVYEKQFEDVRHEGYSIHAHNLLPYYAVEFSCGLITREALLENLEDLLNPPDLTQYDHSTIYQLISLPAYYVQFLKLMPELIPPRRQYVARLYERMLEYVRHMPTEVITDSVQLYVRQAIAVFLEVEGGLSYRELLLSLMARFAPDLFSHGFMVSKLVRAVCEAILDGDPSYFDDVPEAASAPSEARRAVILELAEHISMLHDVGMMNFTSLYHDLNREMLWSENELIRCHTTAGYLYLKNFDSTRYCADAALGHHRWYDGSDGYPASYQRRESPYRALIDILSIADYLDRDKFYGPDLELSIPFEERLGQIFQMEGRRFSPLVVSWLTDPKLQAALKHICEDGFQDGYRQCFHFAAGSARTDG